MNLEIIRDKLYKVRLRSCMIISEFFSKWKYFSFSYAVYSTAWWLGWYIHPFKKICDWGFQKKTKYLDHYFYTRFNNIIQQFKSTNNTPIICSQYHIWIFWAQGEKNMPELVHICYQNIKRLHHESVILITMDNVSHYIDIPCYIYEKLEKGIITYTHFSDIVRVSLLAKYGGLWLDATCWIPQKLPEDIFSFDIITSNTKNIEPLPLWSNSKWCGWGIGTNKINHPYFVFVSELLYLYWEKEDYLIDYLLIDYLLLLGYLTIPCVKQSIDELPEMNPRRNKLWFLLNTPYDAKQYAEITQNNWLFKLSYKSVLLKYINGQKTYYGQLEEFSNGNYQ